MISVTFILTGGFFFGNLLNYFFLCYPWGYVQQGILYITLFPSLTYEAWALVIDFEIAAVDVPNWRAVSANLKP